MKNWSKKKKILIVLLILFLAAQAVQPSKNTDQTLEPSDIQSSVNVRPAISAILKRACYDCHSNHTIYLWYDNITPVNWWVADHIEQGKQELNFTTFNEYKKALQFEKLEEIAQSVENDEMPLKSYTLIHPNAKLSEDEKTALATWARTAMDEMNKLPSH